MRTGLPVQGQGRSADTRAVTASDLSRIDRLHRWLTLESWAGGLGAVVFWLPAGPIGAFLVAAALAFTPYLIVTLVRLRRWGWLGAFGMWVGGAGVLATFVPSMWSVVAGALILFAFYSYTWALRLAVGGWQRKGTEAATWARERAAWDADRALDPV